MDSIRIDTGVKRIQINDGPDFIEFNPTEVNWGRKFEKLRVEVKNRLDELSLEISQIEENETNIEEISKLRDDVCVFVREKIDILFGTGTSQKVFGDIMSEYAIASFLEEITPFIQQGRRPLVQQYLPKKNRHKK
jgi:hypothetical protein